MRFLIGIVIGVAIISLIGLRAQSAEKRKSFKGWELYSWKDGQQWKFSLLQGTNRLKSCTEVKNPKATKTLQQLEQDLTNLAQGEEIYWAPPDAKNLTDKCELAYPEATTVQQLHAHCQKFGLRLSPP